MFLIRDFKNYVVDVYNLSGASPVTIWLVFLLALFSTVLEIFNLGLLLPFFSGLMGGGVTNSWTSKFLEFFPFYQDSSHFLFICAVMFCLILLKSVLVMLAAFIQGKFIQECTRSIRYRGFSSFFNDSYLSFTMKRRANLLYNMNDLSNRFGGVFGNLITAVCDLILAVAILIFLGSFAYKFLLILAAVILFWILFYDKVFGKILTRLGKQVNDNTKKLISVTGDSFDGFKEIILLDGVRFFKRELWNVSGKILNTIVKHLMVYTFQRQLIEFVAFSLLIGGAILVYIGAEGRPEILVSQLGVFAVAIYRLKPFLHTVSKVLNDFRFNKDMISDLKFHLAKSNLDFEQNINQENHEKLSCFKSHGTNFSSIVLKDISFTYPGESTKTIDSISLTVKRGEFIGIYGKSGSGKTTFLDIISFLLPPTSGTIEVNGETGDRGAKLFQAMSGYIPQDTFMVDGSVLENIVMDFKVEGDAVAKCKKALYNSGLSEFIAKTDHRIGEKGRLLSGGQRQRLAIARQLFKDSEFLIFDEATNSVDELTEGEILESIKSLTPTKTVIFVSHNSHSLRFCEKVFVLKDRKISEPMSYEDFVELS